MKHPTQETCKVWSADDSVQLCNGFARFFVEKICLIKDVIKLRLGDTVYDPLQLDARHGGPMFADIQLPSADEIC